MNNIDNLFKKALGEQECKPPDRVWANIEEYLNKRRRMSGLWWYRGIAAAALLAFLVGVWELGQSPEIPQTINLSEKETNETSDRKICAQETETPHLFPVSEQIPPAEVPGKKKNCRPVVSSLPSLEAVALVNSQPDLKLGNGTLRRDFIPLTSKEALKNNLAYLALLKEEAGPVEKSRNKVKVVVSGHFVPAYSSGNYSSSVKNSRGYSYSDDQMKGLMNTGGGLKLSVNAGKRFTFQAGVFYSRMGQKTIEKDDLLRTAAFGTMENHARRVATPLGNIIPKHKNIAYRSAEGIVLNSMAVHSEESLEQVFGALSVPLYVRYKLNKDQKILFSVMGGLSGNFIVNNKVYLKNEGGKELLGSTGDIREFNMSTDWGLGMEYPISQKIKIMIEPGFKYFLQSLSKDKDIDYKPYLFTLSTGIGIEF